MSKLKSFLLVIATACFVASNTSWAVPVDLELSLVIDVSGSVNIAEYNQQMDGYANAFRDADIQSSILGGPNGAIAVNAIFYNITAVEGISFTLLNSNAGIDSFADTLDNFARPIIGGTTVIPMGIDLSVTTFGDETGGTANGFESTRQVIDVSADGASDPLDTQTSRDNALAAGVDTINGIAIEAFALPTVTEFLEDNAIGGKNAFVVTAFGFDNFNDAIIQKLDQELNPVPEPSTWAMMALGLIGLCISRRRKK